jgi:hypothetical protein
VLILPMLLGAFQPPKPAPGRRGLSPGLRTENLPASCYVRPCTEVGMEDEDGAGKDVLVIIKFVPRQILFSGFGG